MAKKDPVKAAKTTLEIIETISELEEARASEVADHLALPESTVHNYLKTLEQNEYVEKEAGVYQVGLRFLGLGERTRSRYKVYEVAKPELKELATHTGELVNLVVEEHGRGVYVYRAKGNKAAEYHTYVSSHVGERVNLHCSASGKAILAHLDQEEVEAILDRHGLPKLTDQTIQDRDTLLEELDQVRKEGVAFDREEQLTGLWSLACPIRKDNQVLGAISISGPASRLVTERFEQELPDVLKETANVISINMTFN